MIENIDNLEIIIEIFNGQDDVLIMNTIMETQNEPVFTWLTLQEYEVVKILVSWLRRN